MTNKTDQWVTIQEASKIIGRSENAIRLLVKRRKFDQLKKIKDNGRSHWVIHRESISRLVNTGQLVMETHQVDQSNMTNRDPLIPLNHYEQQRKQWLIERDQLTQGLMMYRFKYEELEAKIRLLPAPVEIITNELKQKVNLEARIQELEAELKKPWWKRMFRK